MLLQDPVMPRRIQKQHLYHPPDELRTNSLYDPYADPHTYSGVAATPSYYTFSYATIPGSKSNDPKLNSSKSNIQIPEFVLQSKPLQLPTFPQSLPNINIPSNTLISPVQTCNDDNIILITLPNRESSTIIQPEIENKPNIIHSNQKESEYIIPSCEVSTIIQSETENISDIEHPNPKNIIPSYEIESEIGVKSDIAHCIQGESVQLDIIQDSHSETENKPEIKHPNPENIIPNCEIQNSHSETKNKPDIKHPKLKNIISSCEIQYNKLNEPKLVQNIYDRLIRVHQLYIIWNTLCTNLLLCSICVSSVCVISAYCIYCVKAYASMKFVTLYIGYRTYRSNELALKHKILIYMILKILILCVLGYEMIDCFIEYGYISYSAIIATYIIACAEILI